jgi:leader peptidase (prepilin peptidase)/N-methyltransferase
MMEWFWSAGAFVLGLVTGSFLNVVIHRTPRGENIAFPASHCVSCNTPLKWYHNIPLFSWLVLKGKCAFCNAPISKRYPIVEIVTGILFVLLYWKVGLTWYLPFVWASFAALFALVVIDFDYMAVPDSVNFAALVFALINPHFVQSAVDAAVAAGGLYLIGLLSSWIARKEAMGGADVIVAGTMGALLGFPNFFVAIFLSALLAIIPALIKRDSGVPFVPFLALATLIVYLYDSEAKNLVERIIYG